MAWLNTRKSVIPLGAINRVGGGRCEEEPEAAAPGPGSPASRGSGIPREQRVTGWAWGGNRCWGQRPTAAQLSVSRGLVRGGDTAVPARPPRAQMASAQRKEEGGPSPQVPTAPTQGAPCLSHGSTVPPAKVKGHTWGSKQKDQRARRWEEGPAGSCSIDAWESEQELHGRPHA